MSQESRKQIGQVIVLLLLLGVLGFCMWYFVLKPQHAGKGTSKTAPPAAASQQAAQPAADQAGAAPAGKTAAAGGAGAQKTADAATGQGKDKLTKTEAPISLEMNPNQFEVFTLSPPKNPFVQQESWYADKLKELPGYPELRDQGYFDSMEPYLPDLEKYFGNSDKWQEVTLSRQQKAPDYSIEGTSKKGDIATSVKVTASADPPVDITWTPESGIPLSDLRTPGWEKKLPAAASSLEKPGTGGAATAPAGEGLSVPGGGQAAGGSAAQPAGDVITVSGVNLKEANGSAVLLYNGTPYLVSVGSVLPTHYQVLAIKEDGVVLLELRDGSSQWISLSLAGPPGKKP